jgi:hypothetical protein
MRPGYDDYRLSDVKSNNATLPGRGKAPGREW